MREQPIRPDVNRRETGEEPIGTRDMSLLDSGDASERTGTAPPRGGCEAGSEATTRLAGDRTERSGDRTRTTDARIPHNEGALYEQMPNAPISSGYSALRAAGTELALLLGAAFAAVALRTRLRVLAEERAGVHVEHSETPETAHDALKEGYRPIRDWHAPTCLPRTTLEPQKRPPRRE